MHRMTVTELICAHTDLNNKYREGDGELTVIKITEIAPSASSKAKMRVSLDNRYSGALDSDKQRPYDNTTALSRWTAK